MSSPAPSNAPAYSLTSRTMVAVWLAVCGVLAVIGLFQPDGLSVAVLLVAPMVVASLALCSRLDPGGRSGLATVFLVAVTARWICAAAVHLVVYKDAAGLFAPDELTYEYNSQLLVEYLRGHIPDPEVPHLAITWVMCAIYSVIGHLPLVPKLINGVLGGWTAALTTLIAVRIFSAEVARRAGLLAALTPSLVLWAALNTKDTSTLLGCQISLLAFMHMRTRPQLWSLALYLGGLIAVGANRGYEVLFVALPALGSLLVTRGGQHRLRNAVLFFAFAGVAVLIARMTGGLDAIGLGEETNTIDRLNIIREGYAQGAGSAMDLSLVDTSTPGGLLLWLPIGLTYFFLAPIPFTGSSILSSATSPEMLIWYALLPSLVRGLRIALREKAREVSVLLLYAAFSSIGWAIVVTNVGTVYRYRSQMFFVFIILIAVSQIRRKELARRTREEAVQRLRAVVDAVRT